MPIIKSAKKAARQSIKRKNKNQEIKKAIRAALKEFRKNPNAETMSRIQSEYDKAAKKGLIKKNTASRRKANVAKFGKVAGVKLAVAGAKKTSSSTKKTTATTKKAASAKAAAPKKTASKTASAKKTTTTKKASAKKEA